MPCDTISHLPLEELIFLLTAGTLSDLSARCATTALRRHLLDLEQKLNTRGLTLSLNI